MDFALFIVLNALLLLRPEDLFPEIAGLQLYMGVIAVTTAVSLPKLVAGLTPAVLARRPVAVCVLGMLLSAFLAGAVRGKVGEAFDFAQEFAKVVLYFFLLLAVVDTPGRLRAFLGWVVVLVAGSAAVALCHYHEVYQFAGLDPVQQWKDTDGDGPQVMLRIVSAGVFNDPNDFGVMLMTAGVLAVGLAVTSAGGLGRLFWLLPLPLYLYACYLTHSRGAILALMGGVAGGFTAAVGLKRAIPLTALAVPVVLALGSSRGASIGGGGTAHERLMLWADNLTDLFRAWPYIPTGLGPGHSVEEHTLVCHNSFVSAYVEHGLLGGGMFLGLFYFAFRQAEAVGRAGPGPDWARKLRPFAAAAVVTYAVGCYSLTRNFTLPVYLVVGAAAAFADLSGDPPDRFRVTGRWWRWMAAASVAGLVAAKVSTQLLGHAGV